ncbi:MAG: NAD(P)-binding protein [Adhaeribacter sp.]
MRKAADTKIAIIGAGPAGLGAAEALREKGYTHITIFDKNSRVGGQALSCVYETPDKRQLVYDLGSVQPLSSKILLRLLKENGLHFGRGPLENKSKLVMAYSYLKQEEFINFVRYYFGVPLKSQPDLLADICKLSAYLWRYRRLAKPGFYNFKYWEETTVNFRDWVEAREFKLIGDKLIGLIFNLMTLSNKNNESQVQVYAVFKFFYQLLKHPMRYIDGTYRPVKEGYQELWLRIARNFNTVLGADITSITRSGQGVVLTTGEQTYHFDDLIISCPFDRLASVLDTRPEEAQLFTNIHYNPGYRGAFVAKNGPVEGIYWYPDSYETGNEPPYLALAIPEGKVADDTYLYSCVFSHCPDAGNAVNILQSSAAKVFRDQYGAEITEWVRMKYWHDYGCLFDVEMVRQGVFDKVQAMQGKFKTYYTGQLISFSAHASVVDYSYELVDLFY